VSEAFQEDSGVFREEYHTARVFFPVERHMLPFRIYAFSQYIFSRGDASSRTSRNQPRAVSVACDMTRLFPMGKNTHASICREAFFVLHC